MISQEVLRAFGNELKKIAAMTPLPPPKPIFNVAATQAPKANVSALPTTATKVLR